MAAESVKNSTSSKSRRKPEVAARKNQQRLNQPGDREHDGLMYDDTNSYRNEDGSRTPFPYQNTQEEVGLSADEKLALRGLLADANGEVDPKRLLLESPVDMDAEMERRASGTPQWPGRINPDGSRSRMIPPDRTENIEAGPSARPNDLYMRGYIPPEDAIIRDLLLRSGRRI